MVTIKDIADITGVSPTTVANVIHGRMNKVSKENVQIIQTALKEYQYVPKLAQETLTRGKTRLIGVVIHTTKVYAETTIADPFYGLLIGVLEREIRKAGYYTLLYTEMNLDAIFMMASSWNVAGMITITFAEKDYQKLSTLIDNRPLVGIDTYNQLEESDCNVGIDDVNGGFQMTDYLLNCGYEEVIIIIENNAKGADIGRLEGYKRALKKHGKVFQNKYHVIVDPEFPEKKKKQLKEIEQHMGKNWAVFCVSDQLAVEVISRFQEDGYKVPQDIGVAGFDDNVYAKMFYPRLTTIRQDIPQKGIQAVQMLMKLIEGETVLRRKILLDTELIARDTTIERDK